MPDHPTFTQAHHLLRPEEYRSICSALVAMGMEELRVTGGEPTVRPEFRAILASLSEVPALRRSITSNGQLLERHLDFLRDLGWMNLNISLDSLDAGVFERITGGGNFGTVMACIEKAVAMGFQVKINAVVFKGVNEMELWDFARWSAQTGIEVRFLEFMKIGPAYESHWNRFISAEEMITLLETFTSLHPVPVPLDSTAFVFETDAGARLGFIASESQPFCGSCSRLRLSATGVLRSCLMSEQGLSLRGLATDRYPEILEKVMAMKPLGRLDHVTQPMHAIGG
jgi:cyclic pyranopterin phosphate synthase